MKTSPPKTTFFAESYFAESYNWYMFGCVVQKREVKNEEKAKRTGIY